MSDDAAPFDRWPASDALGQESRFRLTREQMENFMLLREIDRHLLDLFGHRPIGWAAPIQRGHFPAALHWST